MVKKIIIGVVIALVFIVGGLGAALVLTNPNGASPTPADASSKTNGKSSSNPAYADVNACDILTEDIANQFIGNDIQKVTATDDSPATQDIAVTNCNYISKLNVTDTTDTPKVSAASLMIRSARTATGAQSNKSQFSSRDSNNKTLAGIGDDAFYNSSFRQLNVLKGNNWYIITAYKDSLLNGSLESNKQLAIKFNFR